MRSERILSLTVQLVCVVILLLCCLLFCIPPQQRPIFQERLQNYKVHLGLDLKGGSELLYFVNPNEIDPGRSAETVVDENIGVISQRIFESGIVKEPRIQRQGENKILIQLPGLNQTETNSIKKEIETLGNLEFRLVSSKNIGLEVDEITERIEYEKAKRIGARRLERYTKRLLETKQCRWVLPRDPKGKAKLLWMGDGYNFTGKKFQRFYYTYFETQRVIGFELKEEFKAYFGNFTEKYKGENLAIVFNNRVISYPNISTRIPGRGVMTGFSADDMAALMKILRSGSLEVQPELLNENTIGPSLGEDAIKLGIMAGIVGGILVLVFMLFYYYSAGLVANIALVFNIAIIFTILVIWGETLTLPGIAGIILTVGMAVDANIIIFERIREEKRIREEIFKSNKKRKDDDPLKTKDESETYKPSRQELLEILDKGYGNAFSTIFDANLTTLITAIILYFFGSGPVQGFAFTLAWGIVASFFTAIVVTRIIFHLMIELSMIRGLAMAEWVKKPKWKFSANMRKCFAVSSVLIVLGLSLFFSRGDKNYGIDLKGGILAHVNLETPLTAEEVRTRLSKKFQVEVQHVGEEKQEGGKWFEFAIRLPNLNQEKIEKVNDELNKIYKEMKSKNKALKKYLSKRRILEEEQRDVKRSLRALRRLKEKDPLKMESLKNEIKRYDGDIAKQVEQANAISAEIQKIRDQRAKQIKLKNEYSGIEQLQKEIEKEFAKELASLPFGKAFRVERGKYSDYVVVPAVMKKEMPLDFITKCVADLKNINNRDGLKRYRDFDIAVARYFVTIKDSKVKKEDIESVLSKQFRISRPKLELDKIENLEEKNGEYSLIINFKNPEPTGALKDAIERCKFESFTTKGIGKKSDKVKRVQYWVLLRREEYIKGLAELESTIQEELKKVFETKEYEGKAVYFSDPFQRFTQISGVVAKAQKAKAYKAILLSLFLILIYIAFRFPNGLIFGFGAVVALAHDVLFTLGAIALFGSLGIVSVEIDLPVIAALLTIVGYSLNDTIVIYDRLRENQKKHEMWDKLLPDLLSKEFDKSLNQTLPRTLLTSLTTFIVLAIIFVLNYGKGSVMEGFSFTLMVGVIVGTYSSVFIASSVVLRSEIKKRLKKS